MEAFIISVMMSAFPHLLGLAVLIGCYWAYTKKLTFRLPFILLIVILVYASIQPSNTYKFRANKIEQPYLVEKIVPEMQLTKPLIEQGKKERQERFDDLTSWRKNVE